MNNLMNRFSISKKHNLNVHFASTARSPKSTGRWAHMRVSVISFWDAMLWGAAQQAGVRHLFTEDLQDGFELAGVRFVDPFEAANNRLIDEVPPPGLECGQLLL